MKFTLQFSALTLLISFAATSAFVPSSVKSTKAWGVAPLAASDGDMLMDTNFDDVNVQSLLGKNTVDRIIKKNAAKAKKADAMLASDAAPASSGEKKGLKLIIAGAPASGKGTQCEIIKKDYGVVHLSTGDMLRAAVAAGTEVGLQAKEAMDAGKLVSDDIIIGVVKDRLDEDDCKANGWLLDGFPRTPAQADALASAGISADCFIFLNVPDEILVERVVGRRTDPETGKIYHMTFSPPDDEEVLARLEQRSDDTEEKVKVRLEQFHANVDAVKGSYSEIGVDIDGTASPDEVSKAISEAVSAKIAA